MSKSITKIQDSFNDQKSAADTHWTASNIQRFYKTFRKPMELPANYIKDNNSVDRVVRRYNLRGFQFGNWVTNEDRFNYLASFYICLYDLNKVLKFKENNLGLSGKLGIALGSRGVPRALAHYEPSNIVINISRYKREDVLKKEYEEAGRKPPVSIPKEVRFLTTGGIGSFAHEYGHFLDFEFGMYYEPNKEYICLTGKMGSTNKSRIEYPKTQVLRNLFEDLFEKILWNLDKKTDYCLRLESTKSDYLNNRQEIFARTFEQYVSLKLSKIGLNNNFMAKPKYAAKHYLRPNELNKAEPIIDKIITIMRSNT